MRYPELYWSLSKARDIAASMLASDDDERLDDVLYHLNVAITLAMDYDFNTSISDQLSGGSTSQRSFTSFQRLSQPPLR